MNSRKAADEVQEASSNMKLIIDLNTSPDAPGQTDGAEDLTGSSDLGSCIDWGRGSIDIAEDGRLAYLDNEPSAPTESQGHGFDHELDAAVQETEAAEEARRFGDFQDDKDNADLDDDDDVPLWFH